MERFKRIFNKLITWGFLEKNPIYDEEERVRYLLEKEIQAFSKHLKMLYTVNERLCLYFSLYCH
ncbi:hypothetical protein FLA4_12090 [Candidatus Rickettsia kotlanii]|nr:hypothetical protein FLA4_12090 [Candidatus Rickettsia kotlanii]BDU62041.1 hypothetical protein HM2_12090 [Candidatus Rickettsia kotlanii]